MRKAIILGFVILTFSGSSPLLGQIFTPLGVGFATEVRTVFADSASGKVYVGGFFTQYSNGDSIRKIAVWDGNNWDSLGSGINDGGLCVSILKYNNAIFFGGSFSSIAGNNFKGLAKWDEINWGTIGDVIGSSGYGAVNSVVNSNNDLYVCGTFVSVNGIASNKIARWDGTSWHTFPVLDSIGYNLETAAFYNNELYVGGQFSASPQMKDIAKFNGISWVPVLNGLSGSGWVADMKVFQNELYVSGYFQSINGDPGNGIIKWNGTSWDDLGGGADAVVYEMEIVNNELYIVGSFNNVSGVSASRIAKWDGNQWHGFGSSINSTIYSISAMNNEIYVAGHFTEIDGIPMYRVAKFTLPTSMDESPYILKKIRVYPTFTTGMVSVDVIQGNLSNISVFNITGKSIFSKQTNAKSESLNLSSYLPGFYFIKIETSLGIVNRKVVLK